MTEPPGHPQGILKFAVSILWAMRSGTNKLTLATTHPFSRRSTEKEWCQELQNGMTGDFPFSFFNFFCFVLRSVVMQLAILRLTLAWTNHRLYWRETVALTGARTARAPVLPPRR